MSKSMKLVRVKFIMVLSVLSLVAAFLVSGVVGSSAALAAGKTLTTFELQSTGKFVYESGTTTNFIVQGGKVTNGVGTITIKNELNPEGVDLKIRDAKATAMSLVGDFEFGPNNWFQMTLVGSNWKSYTGTFNIGEGNKFEFSGLAIKNPPASVKPRAPKSLNVAGTPTAKSFKVSWKAPSTKGDRPVTGYRVIVKAQGASKAAVNKKLAKKVRSYKVSRKALLKSLRAATRGESNVRFTVRLAALNGSSQSTYAKKSFWVAP
ncbi:MAG: fibronectin type III domain-containing protein [Candidatus Nanopelagicales bacterium]